MWHFHSLKISAYNEKYFTFTHERLFLMNPIIAGCPSRIIMLPAYALHIVIYLIK